MQTVRLGRTGLEPSRVGFGGIPIQRLTEGEAVTVVRRCLDLGVTFLDTAHGYTTSEERIGHALAVMAGQRHRYILATKTPARDRAAAQRHLALSLSRLRTDYLDLWQFHNVSSFEAYGQVLGPGGAMEAARKAQEEGVVRHIGITSHSMDVALQAVASGMFETIQFPFNFVTDEAAERLLPLAQANDVGFIAMKPFAGGLLGNARLAIKYLLQFDNVLPDPGIEIVEEIEQIVEIVDGPWALSPEERIEMERVRAEVGTRFCRRCGYCEPCPQGVHISTIMNLRSFWKRFPAERFTTGWIAEAVTSAESCIHCGECEEKCPYHLPIQEMLEENQAFFERASSV
jgi:predicted aldo/keto reductase-like oxidoreductase